MEMLLDDIRKLAAAARHLAMPTAAAPPPESVGAYLVELALVTARARFRSFALPRIETFLAKVPPATTVSAFLATVGEASALPVLLDWASPSGTRLAWDVALFLEARGAQSLDEIAALLCLPAEREAMRLQVHGCGRKLADYAAMRAGVRSVVAVDIFLRRFAAAHVPGADKATYDELFDLYVGAAQLLGVDPATLDAAVWGAPHAVPAAGAAGGPPPLVGAWALASDDPEDDDWDPEEEGDEDESTAGGDV